VATKREGARRRVAPLDVKVYDRHFANLFDGGLCPHGETRLHPGFGPVPLGLVSDGVWYGNVELELLADGTLKLVVDQWDYTLGKQVRDRLRATVHVVRVDNPDGEPAA
jgi:hypothetical protein